MAERVELLEATVDSVPEGVAILGDENQVAFWNQAAQAITGYSPEELIGRAIPDGLRPLLGWPAMEVGDGAEVRHGALIHAWHKMGHPLAAMTRVLILRDAAGCRMGTAVLFHATECLEGLPRGIAGDNEELEARQVELQDRLESLFEDFARGGAAFGVLWIAVDQASDLRKTHGAGACAAMLKKIEKVLLQGLRPTEELGRWGEGEFLVISHEPTAAMLEQHAGVLAGLARTADFRWWGDRVSLTVSIGAAQLKETMKLADVLESAKEAMFASYRAGGNRITGARGDGKCSQS